jgi:hypothetical protein
MTSFTWSLPISILHILSRSTRCERLLRLPSRSREPVRRGRGVTERPARAPPIPHPRPGPPDSDRHSRRLSFVLVLISGSRARPLPVIQRRLLLLPLRLQVPRQPGVHSTWSSTFIREVAARRVAHKYISCDDFDAYLDHVHAARDLGRRPRRDRGDRPLWYFDIRIRMYKSYLFTYAVPTSSASHISCRTAVDIPSEEVVRGRERAVPARA